MKRNINKYLLAILLIIFLTIPIVSIFIDFGNGTDDAASGIVQGITGQEQVLEVPQIGYEPSEAAEPWMFVLQIGIGIILFVIAYFALNKREKENA